MPQKRNTSWSRSKKEKQIITTRLIEISLKVDDYVYKHKPISECEAKQYLTEVSSYKVQCSRDERSLQVIEKLTRCMKAIVLDHREVRSEIHTIHDDSSIPGGVVRAGSLSPVYSIPEEDRTQLTQIAEGANTNVEIVDLTNIDDDDSMYNGSNTAETVQAGSKVTVEVDIHRGISSLSLRDGGEPLDMTMSTDVNCSQSILNNFEGDEQIQQKAINITHQRVAAGLVDDVTVSGITTNVMQAVGNNSVDRIPNMKIPPIIDSYKTIKSTIAPNKPIIICNTANNLKFNTVVPNKEPLKVTNATSRRPTNAFNKKDINVTSQRCNVTNNIPKSQRQSWYDSNRTCTINDSSRTLKDVNHLISPLKINKDVNQVTVKKAGILNVQSPANIHNAAEREKQTQQNNIPMSDSAVVKENTATTKKKRVPKKKHTDEKVIKPKNKRVSRAPKSSKENTFTNKTKKNIIPIYNENVVEDLSWMENIRYVREIRVDENDPKLNLEESFWENYYLPANWSDEFV